MVCAYTAYRYGLDTFVYHIFNYALHQYKQTCAVLHYILGSDLYAIYTIYYYGVYLF